MTIWVCSRSRSIVCGWALLGGATTYKAKLTISPVLIRLKELEGGKGTRATYGRIYFNYDTKHILRLGSIT
ncbi:hypothetical protein ECG_05565 [Echinococcus granulosus]|nr:hypothetical protein ECG_05565 [Echinococcus granulosus]